MKVLPITFTVLALTFIVSHVWLGPIYTMSDGCICGERRAWLEFNENPEWRNAKLFLRIESSGTPQHKHEYWDAKYGGQYPVLVYIGVGFGILGATAWLCRRKRVLPDT